MKKKISFILLGFSVLIGFCCCASFAGTEANRLTPDEVRITNEIVRAAKSFVGKTSLVVRGKRFNADCSGSVMAAYYSAGIDLWPLMAPYKGNGVTRLYHALNDRGLTNRSPWPIPGDLIFWDNTWDKNGNGLRDDYLTHVGLVISVDDDGNVEYFHDHIKKGFVIEKMNLLRPNVNSEKVGNHWVIVNNAIRAAGLDKKGGYLASHLFRGFGRAWQTRFWDVQNSF